MNERIMGMDLSDLGTGVAFSDNDRTFRFPTVLGRDREEEKWFIGEDAYARALNGKGVITDKLLALTEKHGTATIGGIRYEASALLRQFLKEVISACIREAGGVSPGKIVLCIPSVSEWAVTELTDDLVSAGFRKEDTCIIERSESFIYYVMNQNRDVWNNQVGMFCLSDNSLTYFEMNTQRKGGKLCASAEKINLEEAFNLEILSSSSGARLADKILLSCAERIMKKKLFSAVILTGRGFDRQDWATDFMKFICTRRKVFQDADLFARGACMRGMDFKADRSDRNFICICEGRLDTSVTVKLEKEEKELDFPIAGAGDVWYSSKCHICLIPVNATEIELTISPLDNRKKRIVRLPLSFLPKRPPKTTRVDFRARFTDNRTMVIELSDAGFGELFPATDAVMRQEVHLWE